MMDEFICPHWKNFSKGEFDLLFTKVSLTRKSDEKMFYHTHTPIKVKDENSNILEEKNILELFNPTDPRKIIAVIQGNLGTGKSELCVYLSFELEKQGRRIFHIDKNASLMDILTKVIPRFYGEITGKDFPVKGQLEHLYTALQNNPETVAKAASHLLILRLLRDNVLPKNKNYTILGEKLADLVSKNINILSKKGEEAIDMVFVTSKELNSSAYREILQILPWDIVTEAAIEINKILWEEIRQHYKVPTLDEAISELTKVCTSRPIIIFEDFSVAGLDLDKLTLFMESDNPNAMCDFIIAGLQDKVPSRSGTRVERFRYFETTSRGVEGVLFLDQDTCVKFIEPFLTYPKIKNYADRYLTNHINSAINITNTNNTKGEFRK